MNETNGSKEQSQTKGVSMVGLMEWMRKSEKVEYISLHLSANKNNKDDDFLYISVGSVSESQGAFSGVSPAWFDSSPQEVLASVVAKMKPVPGIDEDEDEDEDEDGSKKAKTKAKEKIESKSFTV